MVSLCSHPNSGPLFETYPDCGTLIERKENLGWALGLREAKQSAAHLSRVVISFGDSECQVDVAVNSVSSVCPLSVFSVDCSTVECPPVQQAVCPLDSYETQVRLTADGCCTLPARLVRHPFKFPLSFLASTVPGIVSQACLQLAFPWETQSWPASLEEPVDCYYTCCLHMSLLTSKPSVMRLSH